MLDLWMESMVITRGDFVKVLVVVALEGIVIIWLEVLYVLERNRHKNLNNL